MCIAQALRYQDVDVLAVLDNRAGTYSKLGQHDQALRDARQMIKKDKNDERVRTGQ
jgi:F-box/TPR repeat protein Pof3